ncbi:Alpha/Beta hydrolase protein [Triangularia verruculosa]|uniref:Alpha/Beta hydrolase protein n=1 Tax=Triangularia verruculosa TaxID=2587418 RepID=A0AAN6XR93_9PEZI|nr:Alpha/Beta hydrolase protein [Triangularia verruculosa]
MASLGSWSFTAFPPFPATVLPNYAVWNATNESQNLTYQIGVSWPFEYVTDGNAHGLTAAENFKRRKPVDSAQPDSIVVTIGYPLSNNVYDMTRRFVDLRPPLPGPEGDPPSGADDFIAFINGTLRPWVQNTVFPSVTFSRDALYGHSFGGIFVVYALIAYPGMFDTYLAATPTMVWNNGSLLDEVTRRWGTGCSLQEPVLACANETDVGEERKPAVFITYGSGEQFPSRRRTETEEAFLERKATWQSFKQTEVTEELFYRVQASKRVRDVTLKVYVGQDHAGVASSTLADGIPYFVDW